jgi:hypothetical protein
MNYFNDHEILKQSISNDGETGYYVVGKKGTSAYSFQITFSPGMFALTGDIGELLVKRSLSWLSKSTIKSTSYFLEKTAFTKHLLEFDTDHASEYLRELSEAQQHDLSYLSDEFEEYSQLSYREARNRFIDDVIDFDPDCWDHNFSRPSYATLVKLEALQKFCELRGIND